MSRVLFCVFFFYRAVCSPGIWQGIFPDSVLYVKSPDFSHLWKRRGFLSAIFGGSEQASCWSQAIFPGSVFFAAIPVEMIV